MLCSGGEYFEKSCLFDSFRTITLEFIPFIGFLPDLSYFTSIESRTSDPTLQK
jgi:hypothetical protein